MRPGVDCLVDAVSVGDGREVAIGDVLLRCRDEGLIARIEGLEAQSVALSSMTADREAVGESARIETELFGLRGKASDLVVRADVPGRVHFAYPEDLEGSFLRRGQTVGVVMQRERLLVRVPVAPHAADLVRSRTRSVTVKLAQALERTHHAQVVRELGGGSAEPAPLAGAAGAGDDASRPDSAKAAGPVFELVLVAPVAARPGGIAHVRFDHGSEPLSVQAGRILRRWLGRGLDAYAGERRRLSPPGPAPYRPGSGD